MATKDDRDPKLDTDDVAAHLDRGWTLVEQGDLDGALRSANRVLAIDAEAAEGHTLLGAIAAARGEHAESLEHYRRATAIDPELVDPLLYAAEAHLYGGGDGGGPSEEAVHEALRLCEQALDAAEEEDDYLDALLLQAEAQLADDDEEAALATLEEVPPPDVDLPDAGYHLRAGRVLLEAGDLDRAEAQVRRAIARDPALSDALHALGVVQEARGDDDAMVKTFLAVRKADLAEPPPPWGVPAARFEALAEAALAELPNELRERLANVPVIVSDYPSVELVSDGNDPRMLGLFSGVPFPEQGDGATPHLEAIFLYQRNIERFARTTIEVEDEIRKTLIHEAGHFFGLSEEDLEALGLG